jgi:membrane protease YdiL (CAAX protease family)
MADPESMAGPGALPLERERREPFWSWIDVAVFAVGAPVVIAGVAVGLLTVLKALHLPAHTALALLGMQSLLYVAAYGLLWLILMVRHSDSVWDALRWAVRPLTGGRLFLAGFPLAFAAALLGWVLHAPKIDNPIVKFMSDPVSIFAVVVFASTIGPAAEEAVFRGFLQPIATRTFGAAGGIAGTSLVFATLHGFEYQWCWQYLLLVFAASIAFGWTRMRWNSTGASTLLHAGYNLMFFIGYLLQGRTLPSHG